MTPNEQAQLGPVPDWLAWGLLVGGVALVVFGAVVAFAWWVSGWAGGGE